MLTATLLLLLTTLIAALFRVERSRADAARLRLLVELSSFLQLSTSAAEAIEVIPVFGRHLFPKLDGAVSLIRPGSGAAELVVSWGDAPASPATASVSLPLLAGRDVTGVLTLRARDQAALPSRRNFVANGFADQISLALANLQRQDSLHSRAVRDPLTGLFNRRWMEETLQRELLRAGRGEGQAGLILLDVDHFKQFNDTWGHSAGDAVLQQLARMLQNLSREEDVVCRFGGEEFVVVMPNASTDIVRSIAELLRDHASQLHVHRESELLGRITISAGTALAPLHGLTVPALLGAADRALYAAKNGGRDRVASPPPQIVAA
jgi:diguanylate cyclase (GGDEF)-like protein